MHVLRLCAAAWPPARDTVSTVSTAEPSAETPETDRFDVAFPDGVIHARLRLREPSARPFAVSSVVWNEEKERFAVIYNCSAYQGEHPWQTYREDTWVEVQTFNRDGAPLRQIRTDILPMTESMEGMVLDYAPCVYQGDWISFHEGDLSPACIFVNDETGDAFWNELALEGIPTGTLTFLSNENGIANPAFGPGYLLLIERTASMTVYDADT